MVRKLRLVGSRGVGSRRPVRQESAIIRRNVDRLRAEYPLPEGTVAVATGLVVHGVAAYGFLALAARTLGQEQFAPLGVLWSMIFLVGPGVFIPLEQELARAIAVRRARQEGSGPVIRRAAVIGALTAAGLCVVTLLLSGVIRRELLRGETALLAAFALGLVGYLLGHLTRGTMAGLGRFRAYGIYLGGEGVLRLLGCVVLAAAGVQAVGPYGLLVGTAPVLAVLLAVAPERIGPTLREDGPAAPWSELSGNLGALLAGSLLSLALMNAGPVAVELLATADEAGTAGTFVAGLVIARIPFFVFQGIQGALLPKLASLAGAGRWDAFRSGIKRLVVVVSALGAAGIVAAAAVGPTAVQVLFGDDFALSQRSMTMLALAVALYIVAMSLAQGLIALGRPAQMALGWATGVLAFVAGVAAGDDLLLRVEVGLVAGAAASAIVMGLQLLRLLHEPPTPHVDDVAPAEVFGILPEG